MSYYESGGVVVVVFEEGVDVDDAFSVSYFVGVVGVVDGYVISVDMGSYSVVGEIVD